MHCQHGGHHTPHKVHHRALYISIGIAFLFMLIELIGGYVANSLALISDALHMFTDVGALTLSLVVSSIARWPATTTMSYGYHRAETLGALVSSVSLWALSGVLIYEAILHLIHPEPVAGPLVFVIASLGLIANLCMMRQLHSFQDHNLNMRAAYLHVLGDLLGSAGVILSGVILWTTGWNPIDPIVTILFTCAILFSSGKVIRESIAVLMESTPPGVDAKAVHHSLLEIPGVVEVHDLHIWSASSHKIVLSAHLIADSEYHVLRAAHQLLEEKYGIRHMTLQIEDPKHFEPKYCYDCQNKI